MRYLRWAGLLSGLLIVGVLGGLMAPLPSEAATTPSLKLQINDGTLVELVVTTPAQASAAGVCSSTEIAAGYNLCYRLAQTTATGGSPSRTYKVTGVTTGSTLVPSLLVSDKTGGDKATVTGIQIIPQTLDWTCSTTTHVAPCPNALETHIIKLFLKLKYDFAASSSGITYLLPIMTNANFVPYPASAPLGQPAYTVGGDGITLDGTGIFVGTTSTSLTAPWKNNNQTPNPTTGPLKFQYGGTAGGSQYYSLTQTQANLLNGNLSFPYYLNCNTSGVCTPSVNATYTVTMYGPDAFQLLSSNDFVGTGCVQTNNAGGTLTPNGPPCFSNSKKNATDDLAQQVNQINTNNVIAAQAAGASPGTQCVTDCPCFDPETCTGTIVINLRETTSIANGSLFFFQANGPNIAVPSDFPSTFSISVQDGFGSHTFSDLFVGDLTAPWNFAALFEQWPNIPGFDGSWKVDSIDCTSDLNEPAVIDPTTGQVISPAVIVSEWTVDSGNPKRNATVTKLGKGDTVTCEYHGHKNKSGGS